MQRFYANKIIVYTDLIISTIVDSSLIGLYSTLSLYGLDNFYYRRYTTGRRDLDLVYTDLIISTIVDFPLLFLLNLAVYTDLIISTIVDKIMKIL